MKKQENEGYTKGSLGILQRGLFQQSILEMYYRQDQQESKKESIFVSVKHNEFLYCTEELWENKWDLNVSSVLNQGSNQENGLICYFLLSTQNLFSHRGYTLGWQGIGQLHHQYYQLKRQASFLLSEIQYKKENNQQLLQVFEFLDCKVNSKGQQGCIEASSHDLIGQDCFLLKGSQLLLNEVSKLVTSKHCKLVIGIFYQKNKREIHNQDYCIVKETNNMEML